MQRALRKDLRSLILHYRRGARVGRGVMELEGWVGVYVLGRSRAAYPLCRSRAINIITQFSKCQSTKIFCYTQNSL